MKLLDGIELPRLTKLESSIQSAGQGRSPEPVIEDIVDLSGDALRIIRDGRSEPDGPARRE